MTEKQGKAVAPKTATHTPGPWHIGVQVPQSGRSLRQMICAMAQNGYIADVLIESPGNPANARLIVAACNAAMKVNPENPIAAAEALPDLLEACNLMTYWLELHPIKAMPPSQLVFAKAAIAKATGE